MPTASVADQVTLKSADGTVNVEGEFIAFDDNNYIIRTNLGEFRISADRVRCEGDACPQFDIASADITIKGSDTVGLGVMPLLLEGYADAMSAAAEVKGTQTQDEILAELVGDFGFGDELGSILVSSTTSSDGFRKLLAGETDISMSSRRIRPAEARELRDSGAGNMVSPSQEHIIAIDSLVVITHPDNPIEVLSTEQLADIYAGNITNWNQVGGSDAPISVYTRPQGSGTASVFTSRIFGDDDASFSPNAMIANSNTDMANMVTQNENGIGFVGYAFQRGAKPLNLVNECGITMTPDTFSARTEEYALQRRLYLYNGEQLAEDAKTFVDFVKSSDADPVIQKAGFIGLGIDSRPQPLDGARGRALLDPEADQFEAGFMRDMLSQMVDYDRLSSTFRFATGSSRLDERGMLDMQRLADYLEDQPEGTKVLFVGFTDDVGAFANNVELSKRRSEKVMEDIIAYAGDRIGHIEFGSDGFGEISPSACNTDANGRRINRRVEVWVTAAG